MRSSLTRAPVGATAVVSIAAGSLVGASASFAAARPNARAAVVSPYVSPRAVDNLGLTTGQARNWQCRLNDLGYNPGTQNGELGPNSWEAAQRMFNANGDDAGSVDGIVGPDTESAFANFNSDCRVVPRGARGSGRASARLPGRPAAAPGSESS